jgi:hypothetical protein
MYLAAPAQQRRRDQEGCGQGKHRPRHDWNHDLVVVTVLVGLAGNAGQAAVGGRIFE